MLSLLPDNVPPRLNVLIKDGGAVCCVNCEHCSLLWRKTASRSSSRLMPTDPLERYIARCVTTHRAPEVSIVWQGGEPTLIGLELFRHAVSLTEKYRRSNTTADQTILTDGRRLDHDWCEFLYEKRFLVALRLDEHLGVHSGDVTPAAQLLHWHGVDFTVVSPFQSLGRRPTIHTYVSRPEELGEPLPRR